MSRHVFLAVAYAFAYGAVSALENFEPGMPDVVLLAFWLLAPVVGFLVGRWWVLLAVLGPVVGKAIGWDAAEHDGNSALWPPYVIFTVVLVGLLLLLGVGASVARESTRRRSTA